MSIIDNIRHRIENLTMPYTLTEPQRQYVKRLVKQGKFNNESEVIRAGIRLLEEKESSYLNPAPLPPGTLERIDRRQSKEDRDIEMRMSKASVRTTRSTRKSRKAA